MLKLSSPTRKSSPKPNPATAPSCPEINAKVLRALRAGTRELPGELLAQADELELTASEPQTGALQDRAFDTYIPSLKDFIQRNRTADFALVVRASGSVARQLTSALDAPDFHTRTEGQRRCHLREFAIGRAGREVVFLADGEVSAWLGASIFWPHDPAGRATIRGALLILVTPARANQERTQTDSRSQAPRQGSAFHE